MYYGICVSRECTNWHGQGQIEDFLKGGSTSITFDAISLGSKCHRHNLLVGSGAMMPGSFF